MQILKFNVGIHFKQGYFPLITTRVKLSCVLRYTNMSISLRRSLFFCITLPLRFLQLLITYIILKLIFTLFSAIQSITFSSSSILRVTEFHQLENLFTR